MEPGPSAEEGLLADELWQTLWPDLQPQTPVTRVIPRLAQSYQLPEQEARDRRAFEAALYVLCEDSSWWDLPGKYGSGFDAWRQLRTWLRGPAWSQMHEKLPQGELRTACAIECASEKVKDGELEYAHRYAYKRGRWVRTLRFLVSCVLFPLLLYVQIWQLGSTAALGLAAAVWLLADEFLLQRLEGHFKAKGATAQARAEEKRYAAWLPRTVLHEQSTRCEQASEVYRQYYRLFVWPYILGSTVAVAAVVVFAPFRHINNSYQPHLGGAILLGLATLPSILGFTDIRGSVSDAREAFARIASLAREAIGLDGSGPELETNQRTLSQVVQAERKAARTHAPLTSQWVFEWMTTKYPSLKDAPLG
jgi:hypothetical protein